MEAWAEAVAIPTYGVRPADKNPMFLEKRVYQGSSGVVYPLPVVDRVFDDALSGVLAAEARVHEVERVL